MPCFKPYGLFACLISFLRQTVRFVKLKTAEVRFLSFRRPTFYETYSILRSIKANKYGFNKDQFPIQFPTITVCPNSPFSPTSMDFTADFLDMLDPEDQQNRELFRFIPESLYEDAKGEYLGKYARQNYGYVICMYSNGALCT